MPEEQTNPKQPIKGWGEMFQEEVKVPKKGTMAYAMYLDKLKKKEREIQEQSSVPVDKRVLISGDTTTPDGPRPLTGGGTPEGPGPRSGPGPQTGRDILSVIPPKQPPRKSHLKVPDGDVRITRNYMFLDIDVMEAIKDMTEAESRIYLFLVLRSYGQRYPKNICYTTNSEMSPHIGITHKTAVLPNTCA